MIVVLCGVKRFPFVKNGWRDFVLREAFHAIRTVGQVAPSDFEEVVTASSELKGEG
jgi:hypothetical protein